MRPLSLGGGGATTELVCGYLACDPVLCGPILQGLPSLLQIHVRSDPAGQWLEQSIVHVANEAAAHRPGSDAMLARLSEALFVDTLRRYVAALPASATGWLAGARDAAVGQALALLHQRPHHAWTRTSWRHGQRPLAQESFGRCQRCSNLAAARERLCRPPSRGRVFLGATVTIDGTMAPFYALATVAIPIVMVALWRWRRARLVTRRAARAWPLAAMALLAVAWVPIAGLTTVLVLLEEPWPLSLRHGPDTAAAKTIFRQRFGFDPPAAVTNLYAREVFSGPGEHITSIAFTYLDDGVIDEVVARASLLRVPDGDVDTLRAQPGPRWFPVEDALRRLHEAYRQKELDHPDAFRHLWIDRANRRVYFQDVDTA